jgi:hypothetical protein
MMVDAADVSKIRRVIAEAVAHAAPGQWRIDRMRRHPRLLQKTGVWIFEVEMRNQITAAAKRRGMAMVHTEQGSFVTASIHAANQFKQVRFRTAKEKVVLVAIKNSHIGAPVAQSAPGTDPQTGGDFAVGHS